MVSRILEIFVILALRLVFSRANAKRDRDVAEGRVQYDERVTGLQDISDWKNPAFRYVLVRFACPFRPKPVLIRVSLVSNICS
jgi:glutathionyl-hydroquinone reductase